MLTTDHLLDMIDSRLEVASADRTARQVGDPPYSQAGSHLLQRLSAGGEKTGRTIGRLWSFCRCYEPNSNGEYAEGMKIVPPVGKSLATACRRRQNGKDSRRAGGGDRRLATMVSRKH